MLYLGQYNQNILKKSWRYITFFFSYQVFEIGCTLYTYSATQFRWATFQVLRSHMWLRAAILSSIDLGRSKATKWLYKESGLSSSLLFYPSHPSIFLPIFLSPSLPVSERGEKINDQWRPQWMLCGKWRLAYISWKDIEGRAGSSPGICRNHEDGSSPSVLSAYSMPSTVPSILPSRLI